MTNVASFEEFQSDLQIAAHQAGLVRVVLEGDTDVKLFKGYWFSDRTDVFDFIEAKSLVTGAGCTAVAAAVAASIAQGVPAIGIVDRDTLFRNKQWALLFDSNPAALNQNWSTAGIYTASLWEVEAYLIEPDLLSDWVGAVYKKAPAPQANRDAALRRTIEGCRFVLAAAHYLAALHEDGTVAPNIRTFSDQSLAKLTAACAAGVAAAGAPGQAVATAVLGQVGALLAALPVEGAEQLRFLLRYVDTKRLLVRLEHSLDINSGAHWTLAAFMKLKGARPRELSDVLNDAEARLVA
jgi:hypothetical protein